MVPKVAVDVDDEVTCDVVIVDGDEDDCDEEECDRDDLCVDCVDAEMRVELELIGGTDPLSARQNSPFKTNSTRASFTVGVKSHILTARTEGD